MTEDEFYTRYGRSSGRTKEQLIASGLVALPCDCMDDTCKGWKMVNKDDIATKT